MRLVLKICLARGRLFRRFLSEHAFVLFILGPMVVGAVAWVAERYLNLLRQPLLQLLDPGSAFPDRASTVLGLVVAALLWPSSLREVFGRGGRGQDLLDVLPISEGRRFLAAAWVSIARVLGLALVFVAGLWALEQEPAFFELNGMLPARLAVLGLAFAAVAMLDLLLVVVLVPLGLASTGRLLGLAGAAIFILIAPFPSALWLLSPLSLVGRPLAAAGAAALGSNAAFLATHPTSPSWMALLVFALLSATVAGWIFVVRRRGDLEKAQSLDLPAKRSGLPGQRLLQGLMDRLPPSTVAQLKRDLLMILRRFSPAVPLALGLTLLSDLMLILVAFDPNLPALWIHRAMVSAAFVGALAMVSMVPFLLKDQLPVFWLEKSSGVALDHVWQTKWILSALVVLPQVLVTGLLILWLSPGESWDRMISVLQMIATAGIAATLVGTTVFEIAEQPILGLLFSAFVSSAVASLMIFYPQAWWLWLAFFGYLVSLVSDRAARRVRYTEVEL